jgi:hypothetical protein
MSTDFRALCAELVNELRAYKIIHPSHETDLLDRACAALAAPEQGPTDEDLYDLANDCDLDRFEGERSYPGGVVVKEGCWEAWDHQLVAFARAVIARWGRPAVEPVPVIEWHEDIGDALWWRFPIEEPPYVGSPLDTDWPGHHTHFTLLPVPQEGE